MDLLHPIVSLQRHRPLPTCIKEHKRVFITKNGNGHLVIISQQLFEEQQALLELYDKLDEAEDQSRAGKRRPFREVMADLRGRRKSLT
ncbi:MAG: prevent-host-death protein [Desulfocucumaceae bacterium]